MLVRIYISETRNTRIICHFSFGASAENCLWREREKNKIFLTVSIDSSTFYELCVCKRRLGETAGVAACHFNTLNGCIKCVLEFII